MARLYHKSRRSNWIVGVPLWLAVPAVFVATAFMVAALAVAAGVFVLVEAGKGGAWLWRHWRTP